MIPRKTIALTLAVIGAASVFWALQPQENDTRALLHLPDGIALPRIPDSNPLTAEKIALGRQLFYETRLSANETQSCASCHEQALAFSDGLERSIGSTDSMLPRNAQSLVNLGWLPHLTWANSSLTTLEEQIHIPIRADNPVELGVNDGNSAEILARLSQDGDYAAQFAKAFPESETGPTWNKTVFALASFVRTMTSFSSRADAFSAGDTTALNDLEKQGLALFNGERLECFHCHSGPTLTTSYVDATMDADNSPFMFFSNGLYNVGNKGDYPANDQGLYEVTLNPRHRGLFRAPTLRNIAVTAPYMHDGSIATLEDVVAFYAAGGRNITEGPLAGDGRLNPNRSALVAGFAIIEGETRALVAYLKTLTDETFLQRPDLAALSD